MNPEEEKLWQKIKSFELNDFESPMNFTERLCRENHWTIEYATRAVLEYKRFMFLICVAGHPCTPSDQVDQVWHLHLLYTRSYWKDFCPNILGREIHHGPTKGGKMEQAKYTDLYQQTLESYHHFFTKKSPDDIWPSPKERMRFIRFERVNKHQYWVLIKPKALWN